MTNDLHQCAQHQVQLERLEHIRETLHAESAAAHRRIDEMETDVTRLSHILNGNGTEGIVMRVHSVERSVASLSQGLDKIQQTMTHINRAAWGIIAMIGVTALYWAAGQIVGR